MTRDRHFSAGNDDDLLHALGSFIGYSIPIYKMSGYESDSSGSEGNYTETNVLLGYASKESTDDTISQLGGHPVC